MKTKPAIATGDEPGATPSPPRQIDLPVACPQSPRMDNEIVLPAMTRAELRTTCLGGKRNKLRATLVSHPRTRGTSLPLVVKNLSPFSSWGQGQWQWEVPWPYCFGFHVSCAVFTSSFLQPERGPHSWSVQRLGEPGEKLQEKDAEKPRDGAPGSWRTFSMQWIQAETLLPLSSVPQTQKPTCGLARGRKRRLKERNLQNPSS